MAETVSWDGLRELAEFKAEKGCAISLYVDLDPSTAPTAGDVATRISALLNDGERHSSCGNADVRRGFRSNVYSEDRPLGARRQVGRASVERERVTDAPHHTFDAYCGRRGLRRGGGRCRWRRAIAVGVTRGVALASAVATRRQRCCHHTTHNDHRPGCDEEASPLGPAG